MLKKNASSNCLKTINEWINENLATKVKVNNWSIHTSADGNGGNYFLQCTTLFSSDTTLVVSTTPGQTSLSGVVDQHVMDSTVLLCVLLFGHNLV